jgi:hypothetical protein
MAKWSERQLAGGILGQGPLEAERTADPFGFAGPGGQQHSHGLCLEAVEGIGEYLGRGAVEPLQVVDCKEDGVGLREGSEGAEEGE